MARRKHPGGRPPKPPEERKSEILRFRVTALEADALYRKAIHAGCDLGPYLYSVVAGACLRGPETKHEENSR